MPPKSPIIVAGIPYGPDIRKLEEAFPNPQEDQVIKSEDFEAIIKVEQKTSRFYGVINAWRRRLRNERNIDSEWIPSVGVKILNPADRLKVSEGNIKHGIRKTSRAYRRLAITPRDRLDAVGQQRYDHQMEVAAKLVSAGRDAKRDLAIDLAPVKSLPKPKLVVNE